VNREPDPEGGSEIGGGPPQDEFDAIVSGWRLEGTVPEWPADGVAPSLFEPEHAAAEPEAAESGVENAAAPPPPVVPPMVPPIVPRPLAPPERPEFDHFVPPEPPPLPRLAPPAIVGIGLLLLGLVLIISPNWVGVSSTYGLPLGLLALAAGLGWLVLRLWPDAPETIEPDDDDDGAVL
jgi:hypothetical protein